jgi:hypothetical protein
LPVKRAQGAPPSRAGAAEDGLGQHRIEEPVLADDFEASCARIAAAVRSPVQIGENFHGPDEMRAAIPRVRDGPRDARRVVRAGRQRLEDAVARYRA